MPPPAGLAVLHAASIFLNPLERVLSVFVSLCGVFLEQASMKLGLCGRRKEKALEKIFSKWYIRKVNRGKLQNKSGHCCHPILLLSPLAPHLALLSLWTPEPLAIIYLYYQLHFELLRNLSS